MEINLYTVTCNNDECGHEFMTSSTEHSTCPSCGEENITYSNDSVVATYTKKDNLDEILDDQESILLGILIASSYISNDYVIARYDDNSGFKLNFKESNFTDDMVKLLGLSSFNELVSLIFDTFGEDIHAKLIYDCRFSCIERDSYSDEYGALYESGEVYSSDSKEFYNWINSHKDFIKEMFSDDED